MRVRDVKWTIECTWIINFTYYNFPLNRKTALTYIRNAEHISLPEPGPSNKQDDVLYQCSIRELC